MSMKVLRNTTNIGGHFRVLAGINDDYECS